MSVNAESRFHIKRCLKKRRYDDESEALTNAAYRVGKDVSKLRAYKCPVCKGWHLTSRV